MNVTLNSGGPDGVTLDLSMASKGLTSDAIRSMASNFKALADEMDEMAKEHIASKKTVAS